ncbi:MAG: hypothetical protein ACFFBD_26720 [Candidatus Hodarchaeota archaeon]
MEVVTLSSQKKDEEQDTTEVCFECGGILVETFADVVCNRCGLVQRRNYVEPHFTITEQAEHQNYSAYVAQSNRPNIVDDLGSFVGHYRSSRLRDADGNRLPVSKQNNFQRQKKINDLDVHTQGKKRQYRALRMLNALMGVLELASSTKDDAAILFQKTEAKLEGHVYIAEMIAGAVYLSVRTNSTENLQLKDLMQACENAGLNVRSNKIIQAAALIRKITGRQIKVPSPSDYFEKVYNKITQNKEVLTRLQRHGLSVEEYRNHLRATAKDILDRVKHATRGGRNPYITTSAIFIGADILLARSQRNKRVGLVPQSRMAKICEVAEFTLREHYLRIIKPILKEMKPELFTEI